MPREAKGPRLYLRKGRVHPRTGKPIPDVYFIRDGATQLSTGCGPDRLHGPDGAEAQLAAYIARKWSPEPIRTGDPASVLVAEVLAFYAQRKAPKLADPAATAVRVRALLDWWADKTLGDVKLSTCEAYVDHRTQQPLKQARSEEALKKRVTVQGARRELEDLSSAIGLWQEEHHLTYRPKVSLPAKAESPRDALTRSDAAALLIATMGWRRGKDGRWKRLQRSSRANRAHLRRLVLIGLYTGTRPGVIPKLLWEEAATQAWVDLEKGIIYRRGKLEREHKTKKRPLVKLPDRLAAHLRRWRRLDLARAEALAKAAEARGEAPKPAPVTVLHHGGEPITGKLRRGFASCVADAGLNPDVSPHWLRHTCATWLMESSVELWEAAGYTGMSTKTLESCYGHHRPDHQEQARKALGGKR